MDIQEDFERSWDKQLEDYLFDESLFPEEAKKEKMEWNELNFEEKLACISLFTEEAKKDENSLVRLEAYRVLGFSEEAKEDADWEIRKDAEIYLKIKKRGALQGSSFILKEVVMARADLLTSLVKFGVSGDKSRFRKVVETIIAEERSKQHTVLAEKLEKQLQHSKQESEPVTNGTVSPLSTHRIDNLLHEISPQKRLDDLILPEDVKLICREVVQEHHRVDLLRSYSLEPRNRILLIGSPGNGKTSLAEAIAESLMVPFYVVRYEGVVVSYLGETAVKLRQLIDYVCTRKCVLFFDEFETLSKERGDLYETGEIKRLVSSLLLQIDSLPSNVVVIGATNHPEMLDRAVWRRFQVRMDLPEPTRARLEEWLERFQRRLDIDLGDTLETLVKKLYGLSFAEIEEFGATIFRQYILEQPNADMKAVVGRTLKYWATRFAKTEQDIKEMINK